MGDFDVVIVGARCAGAPLATLLAREGVRVAVVEQATFPRDTLSTHMFQAPGMNFLRRIGVLDDVLAAGSKPMTLLDLRRGAFHSVAPGNFRPGDLGGLLSVRRFVLDPLLAKAAEDAGAEVMMGAKVTGLIDDGGRVGGVRVQVDGAEREITARLVVGADGRNSTVGKLVGSRKYHVVPSERFGYWGFFEGASPEPEATAIFHLWDGRCVIAGPSDGGLYQVIVLPDHSFLPEFKADREQAFMDHANACEPVAKTLAGATRVGKLFGLLTFESYFREAAGPGWALAGDAGHFKDPTPGQGMSDAFRQVGALAPVIVRGLAAGDDQLDEAVAGWAKWRDEDAFEYHWMSCDTGAGGASPPAIPEMMRRAEAQGQLDLFVDLFQHRVLPSKVATPGRLLRSTAGLALRRGADRPQLLRDVRTLVGTEIQRQKLRHKPVFVDPVGHADAGETEVETVGAAA